MHCSLHSPSELRVPLKPRETEAQSYEASPKKNIQQAADKSWQSAVVLPGGPCTYNQLIPHTRKPSQPQDSTHMCRCNEIRASRVISTYRHSPRAPLPRVHPNSSRRQREPQQGGERTSQGSPYTPGLQPSAAISWLHLNQTQSTKQQGPGLACFLQNSSTGWLRHIDDQLQPGCGSIHLSSRRQAGQTELCAYGVIRQVPFQL